MGACFREVALCGRNVKLVWGLSIACSLAAVTPEEEALSWPAGHSSALFEPAVQVCLLVLLHRLAPGCWESHL